MKPLDGVMFAILLACADGHRVDSGMSLANQLVISDGGELDMDEEDLRDDPVENETANIATPEVLSVAADPVVEPESTPNITPNSSNRTVTSLEQSEKDMAPPKGDVEAVIANQSGDEHNQADFSEHNQSAHLQRTNSRHRHSNRSADVNLTGRLAVAHVHAVRQLKEALWPLVRANDSEDRCPQFGIAQDYGCALTRATGETVCRCSWAPFRTCHSPDEYRLSALDGKNASDIAGDEFLTSVAKAYAAGRCQLSGLFVIFVCITMGLTIAGVLTLLVDIRKRRALGHEVH
jgi:hypothetical protein